VPKASVTNLTIGNLNPRFRTEEITSFDAVQFLTLESILGMKDLEQLGDCKELKSLTLNNCPDIESLNGIAKFTKLRSLVLNKCPKLLDLKGVESASLTDLRLNELHSELTEEKMNAVIKRNNDRKWNSLSRG